MKNLEYLIRLRQLFRPHIIHKETLLIPEENCFKSDGRWRVKESYVSGTLIPYLDLLHDYGLIYISYKTSYSHKFFRSEMILLQQ